MPVSSNTTRHPALLLVLVWGLLYLPNLNSSPEYYVDEGYAIELAKGWHEGRLGGPTYSRPLAAYMPLHRILLWPAVAVGGGDPILWGRLLSVVVALLVALFLWEWGRKGVSAWAACLPALWFLTYDQSLVLYRMAYPHALCGLGLLLLFGRWESRGWIRGAGVALSFWSHQFALPAIALAGLLFIKRKKDLLVILGTLVASLGLFFAMIAATGAWSFVAQDIGWQSGTFGEDLSHSVQNRLFIAFLYFSQDPFHAVAFIAAVTGLLRRELASVAFLALAGLMVWQRQNIVVFNYPDLLLLPLAGKTVVDSAVALARWSRARPGNVSLAWFPSLKPSRLLLLAVCLAAIGTGALLQTANSLVVVWSGRGPTLRFGLWATQDMEELRNVAEWLNQRVDAGDLVLANPTLGALGKAVNTDWLTATLHRGETTTFSPTPWSRDRFVRNLSPTAFSYVVIGDSDQIWALHQPNVRGTLLQFDGWPIAFRSKNFLILENPVLPENH